jgi:hypothetical protein
METTWWRSFIRTHVIDDLYRWNGHIHENAIDLNHDFKFKTLKTTTLALYHDSTIGSWMFMPNAASDQTPITPPQ